MVGCAPLNQSPIAGARWLHGTRLMTVICEEGACAQVGVVWWDGCVLGCSILPDCGNHACTLASVLRDATHTAGKYLPELSRKGTGACLRSSMQPATGLPAISPNFSRGRTAGSV
jgi:hypothetical protein